MQSTVHHQCCPEIATTTDTVLLPEARDQPGASVVVVPLETLARVELESTRYTPVAVTASIASDIFGPPPESSLSLEASLTAVSRPDSRLHHGGTEDGFLGLPSAAAKSPRIETIRPLDRTASTQLLPPAALALTSHGGTGGKGRTSAAGTPGTPGIFVGDRLYSGDGGVRLESLWRLELLAPCLGVAHQLGDSVHSSAGVSGEWPDVPPWLPLRRCNGRYSLGRQWAQRLGQISPDHLAAAAVACSNHHRETLAAALKRSDDAADAGCGTVEVDSTHVAVVPALPRGTPSSFLPATQFTTVNLLNRTRPEADAVVLVRLRGGGGLISYCKGSGDRFVHTFNTESGLCRKVLAIGGEAAVSAVAGHLSPTARIVFAVCCRVLNCIDDTHGERTTVASSVVVALRHNLARATFRTTRIHE
jgi:hypothetical protein